MERAEQQITRVRRLVDLATGRPQIMFFLPAGLLAAYFLGGEAAMVALALAIPASMALGGLLARKTPHWQVPRDAQTGLALRAEAEQALSVRLLRAETGGKTPAAVVLGIDDYTDITDRIGAAHVQDLMRQCGERLTQSCRDVDVVAALGKGHFGVALGPMRRTDLEVMIQISARLMDAMAEPFVVDGTRVHLTVSVGFCLPGRAPSRQGDAMMKAAELALEEAFAAGPSSIRSYSPDLSRRAETRTALQDEISHALEHRQIVPWFIPQCSTETGLITGLATTPRWHHDTRGVIIPSDFMHLVAAQGAMADLDDLITNAALRALSDWDKTGLGIPTVSTRLHRASLADTHLAEKLKWTVDRFDLTPDRLILELPESLVTQKDEDVSTANLHKLHEAGFKIDLCGFGTGQAALADLRRYNIGRIKIDPSFVARVDRDREQQNMVAALLTMAEKLSIPAVTCGVATAGEHAMLAQLGCQVVEGHAVSGPMRQSDVADWALRYRAKLPKALRITKMKR